jgi:hypothetical protein
VIIRKPPPPNADIRRFATTTKPSAKIEIRESSSNDGKGVHLSGVERKQVTSTDEVHNHVREGNKIRSTATTLLNQRSSRSHAVLTLEIETITPSSAASVKMGKLNIVDLAGSERVQMSGVVGDALAEGKILRSYHLLYPYPLS